MKIIASRKRNILRPEEEHGTFRRTAQDQMNNGTRQRLAVTPNRKKESDSRTMVETIRNEAINQVAVGGNVRATKPAAANPAPWKQYRDTKRRNPIVTSQVKTREHENICQYGGSNIHIFYGGR